MPVTRILTGAVFAVLIAFFWLSASDAQQASICKSFYPGWAFKYSCEDKQAGLYIGRGDEWKGAPDFYFSMEDLSNSSGANKYLQWGTPKLGVRSLMLADIGDAPDLAIRRAGPDNAPYNGVGAPTEPGTNLGNIYWQSYGGTYFDNAQYGWWPGNGHNGRAAMIYARTCGFQTKDARAGEIYIATSPNGNPGDPVDKLRINCAGDIQIKFGGAWKTLTIKDGFVKAS